MEQKEKPGIPCALTRMLKTADDVIWYCSNFLGKGIFFVCCSFLPLHHYIQGVTGGTDQTSGGCSLC